MAVELLVELGGLVEVKGLVEVGGLVKVKLPLIVGGLLKVYWLLKEGRLVESESFVDLRLLFEVALIEENCDRLRLFFLRHFFD